MFLFRKICVTIKRNVKVKQLFDEPEQHCAAETVGKIKLEKWIVCRVEREREDSYEEICWLGLRLRFFVSADAVCFDLRGRKRAVVPGRKSSFRR